MSPRVRIAGGRSSLLPRFRLLWYPAANVMVRLRTATEGPEPGPRESFVWLKRAPATRVRAISRIRVPAARALASPLPARHVLGLRRFSPFLFLPRSTSRLLRVGRDSCDRCSSWSPPACSRSRRSAHHQRRL
jgi:hypothetical protein